jgi:pimeloyl-ACP methyl ester carboxylesterase
MRLLAVLVAGLAVLLLAGAAATYLIVRSIEARYPPAGRFVEVTGGRLHYIELGPGGKGPAATVLLLHGASGSSGDPIMALGHRLAAKFRVIAVDRPGSGWSDRIAGKAAGSPAVQATIIREALERLGVERAIVVGHSWSGALATNLALDHADKVAGLLLLAPVTHPWPGGAISWYYTPVTWPFVGEVLARTLTVPAGFAFIAPTVAAVFAPQLPPPDYIDGAQIALVLRPPSFRANARDVKGLNAFVTAQSRRYGAIRAPTVIISGDADAIVWTNLHSRSLAREIPGAKLVILPGVGHMPHYAAPDIVVSEIEGLAERAHEPQPPAARQIGAAAAQHPTP